MRKLSKVRSTRTIAFVLGWSLALMPLTANAAVGRYSVASVTEFGAGGEPVTVTQGDCVETALPACASGHTCECIKVTPMLQAAGEARAVWINSAKARPLAETMLVDLTDSLSNGAGGVCYPWNGLGVLAISSKNTITLDEQGRLCEDDDASELIASAAFDIADGKGLYAGAQGRGTISFNLEPAPGVSSGHSSPAIIIPIAIGIAALVSAIAVLSPKDAIRCLVNPNDKVCKK
jgi:hypothetical protein